MNGKSSAEYLILREQIVKGKDKEIADLRARCEMAEKDVERYRWIRDANFYPKATVPTGLVHSGGVETVIVRGRDLDDYLDAAIAKERTLLPKP